MINVEGEVKEKDLETAMKLVKQAESQFDILTLNKAIEVLVQWAHS